MIAPANLDWFAVFSFDAVGYVKDDEKIDADALLETLKKSDGPGNEERKRLGMEPIYTDGWHVPPHYDVGSKHAEFKSGDRIAEYGLGALVLGGAAAAAAKAGLFTSLGKFLWVIIGGALMAAWALLKKFFGRKETPPPSPGQQ